MKAETGKSRKKWTAKAGGREFLSIPVIRAG